MTLPIDPPAWNSRVRWGKVPVRAIVQTYAGNTVQYDITHGRPSRSSADARLSC